MDNTIDRKEANKIFKNAVEKRYKDSIKKINEAIKIAANNCNNYLEFKEDRHQLVIHGDRYQVDYPFCSDPIIHYYKKFGYTVEREKIDSYSYEKAYKITISW